MISTKQAGGGYRPDYVGQAKSLLYRVADHYGLGEKDDNYELYCHINKYTTKVSYARCSEHDLDSIEKYLIHKLSPRFNRNEGNGYIETSVNLPDVIVE